MTQDSVGSFSLPQQTLTPSTLNLSRSQLLGFAGKLSAPSNVRVPSEIKQAAEGEDKTCKWEVERKHIAKPGHKPPPRAGAAPEPGSPAGEGALLFPSTLGIQTAGQMALFQGEVR